MDSIVHSTFERDLLAREAPGANVILFLWAIDVRDRCRLRRSGMAIIGGSSIRRTSMRRCISRRSAPLVRLKLPHARLHIVGSNPPRNPPAGRKGRERDGFVPDLGPMLDRIRLSVAPSGLGRAKGKIATT